VGYIVTIAAWVWEIHRNKRLKLVLKHLDQIPESQRVKFIRDTIDVDVPKTISAEQWLRGKKHQYFLLALVISALTVLAIFAIAAWKGSARLDIDSVQQVLDLEGEELELAQSQAASKEHRFIFDITVRNPTPEPVSITDIRIVFDPDMGPAIASVQEISGTYIIRISEEGTVTTSPVGRFEAYAWYPSGSGTLYVKSPLAQTVEPRSVDRFRVIVEFPEHYQFRGDMKEAALQVLWNDERYERSKSIKLVQAKPTRDAGGRKHR
jgi:hypothetical protein